MTTTIHRTKHWITWLTGVIAFAAIAQIVIYIFQTHYIKNQLHANKKSTDLARRSLEVAYQAKVGISSMTLRDPWAMARRVDDNATLSRCCIEMILINTGSTMARNISFSEISHLTSMASKVLSTLQ